MKTAFSELMAFVFIVSWIIGAVLAKGAGATLAAIFIPPYSWYLVIEWILKLNGWLI